MSARAVVAALPHRIRVEALQRFERMKQDGLSDGGFVLVHAWSCGVESGTAERWAAARTAAATCDHSA